MLLMSSHPSFIPRQGLVVNPGASPKQDWLDHSSPPKMFMFGGGYIGFQVGSNKKVRSNPLVLILSLQQMLLILQFTRVSGYTDGYYSLDGVEWTKINYEEGGGGASTMAYYSSQEWVGETVCVCATRVQCV